MSASRFYLLSLSLACLCTTNTVFAAKGKVESLYKTFCYNCHGPRLNGGLGGSLVDDEWKHGSSDEDIARVIRDGLPSKGMPPWKKALSEQQIRAMVIYIREKGQQARSAQQVKAAAPENGVYNSGGHAFVLESVATDFAGLWAVDFLPDGSLLTTEKATGRLWHLKGDSRTQVKGLPEVWPEGQGGLMDVRVLPNSDNETLPWVYLSYSEGKNEKGMTAIIRGKVIDSKWQQQQMIFQAPKTHFLPGGRHFGSRIAFQGQYLFFSIGDRGHREMAQDLTTPNGKIHRVFLDGKIPEDNPFLKYTDAVPSIWSYGQRNPQGLASGNKGILWETEHGPRGGDEINIIIKGGNYGWPLVTHGMNYNGTPITDKTTSPGMEQPVHDWTPSIAVTGILEYTGKAFPKWKNHLLVGSLAKQELQRFRVDGATPINKEILLKNRGRIRDIVQGPDGLIYLVINTVSTPRKGTIYRIKPLAHASRALETEHRQPNSLESGIPVR